MQVAPRDIMLFCPPPYSTRARTKPPTRASAPLARFAVAAFGAAGVMVEPEPEPVGDPPVGGEVRVVERVTFEAGVDVGTLVAEVPFALVEVVTTVTVDEGTDEVEVLVYEGPVERLMVVVEPDPPAPLMWNGNDHSVLALVFSS